MVGNSLKYTTASSTTLNSNTLWKYYQNRNNNKTTSTPAHLVLSPTDNSKIINFMKFADLGTNNVKDSAAFKKIQYFSKTNPQQQKKRLHADTVKNCLSIQINIKRIAKKIQILKLTPPRTMNQ